MTSSVSSEEGISSPLLGRYPSMPPTAMRSTKSVVNQVKDTLFSFLKKAKAPKLNKETEETKNLQIEDEETIPTIPFRFSPEVAHSRSRKERTDDAFLERMMTFSVPNWMGKPLALSPPLLAHYGWQCIGLDSVKCCSCAAILSVRLPWADAGNYRQQCLNYRQKILTAHMKICTWPSYPCPDSFVSPFLHGGPGSDQIRSEYVERKKNLEKLGNRLPQLKREILQELNLNEAQLKSILIDEERRCSDAETENDSSDTLLPQGATAALLALCGWDTKCDIGSASPSVFCNSTARTIGLWNFFTPDQGDVPSDAEEISSNQPDDPESKETTGSKRPPSALDENDWEAKRQKMSGSVTSSPSNLLKIKKKFFHPLQQHHPWSPWITVLKPISFEEFEDDLKPPESENDKKKYKYIVNPAVEGARPGWEVVRDTLVGKKLDLSHPVQSQFDDNSATAADDDSVDCDTLESKQKLLILTPQRTPPKSAVVHVRKLLKEWSSPN